MLKQEEHIMKTDLIRIVLYCKMFILVFLFATGCFSRNEHSFDLEFESGAGRFLTRNNSILIYNDKRLIVRISIFSNGYDVSSYGASGRSTTVQHSKWDQNPFEVSQVVYGDNYNTYITYDSEGNVVNKYEMEE